VGHSSLIDNNHAETAPHSAGGRGRAKKERCYVIRPGDAVPRGTCARCGLIGKHDSPAVCISSLRDRLSRYE
jgi:hypothetical protein